MAKHVAWLMLGGVLCSAMSACGTTPQAPSQPQAVAVTPSKEPPSATGNPPFYEVFGKRYYVQGSSAGYRERGHASWYGPKFHGKRTSSGTPFDMHALTAAHKSLPIPTYARVTHLGNGRSIVVRINDRGPFVDGRFIDLSYAAAVELDMIDSGIAPVEVIALPPYQYLPGFEPDQSVRQLATAEATATPKAVSVAAAPSVSSINATAFYLQVGAFVQPHNAKLLRTRLADLVEHAIHVHDDELYRVRIGPLADPSEALRLKGRLVELGVDAHMVVLE